MKVIQADEVVKMIQVSENAAERIQNLIKDDGSLEYGSFLRVSVKPGGCSGLSYKLTFDNKVTDADKTFEQHGVKIVVDRKSYLHIIGMTLDFSGGLNGRGFVFENPSASKTCGCGSSFAV